MTRKQKKSATKYPTETGVPVCFPDQQTWDQWREHARSSKLKNRSHYCTDCTADYQQRMLNENRCMHPYVTFHLDKDGFIEGRRPYDLLGEENGNQTTGTKPLS